MITTDLHLHIPYIYVPFCVFSHVRDTLVKLCGQFRRVCLDTWGTVVDLAHSVFDWENGIYKPQCGEAPAESLGGKMTTVVVEKG